MLKYIALITILFLIGCDDSRTGKHGMVNETRYSITIDRKVDKAIVSVKLMERKDIWHNPWDDVIGANVLSSPTVVAEYDKPFVLSVTQEPENNGVELRGTINRDSPSLDTVEFVLRELISDP